MVWKLFKQNRYKVEWYKLSVGKKRISDLPMRTDYQQDFRGSGSRSLNIFDSDLSLVEPILCIWFFLIHTLYLPISNLPEYSPVFIAGVFSTLWQNGRGRDFCMFWFWVTNINFLKYFKIWMLSLITCKFPIFLKGEVSVKNVHYPSWYQVYLLLKRDAYKIGKRTVCLFNFFNF